MCPSVISSPATPGNHMIFSSPSALLNSASMCFFLMFGFLFLLIILLSVNMAVPSPSTSIAPPSVTKLVVILGT